MSEQFDYDKWDGEVQRMVEAGQRHIDSIPDRPFLFNFDKAWSVFLISERRVPEFAATVAYERLMKRVCPNRIILQRHVYRDELDKWISEHSRKGGIFGLFGSGRATSIYFSDVVDATYFRLMN